MAALKLSIGAKLLMSNFRHQNRGNCCSIFAKLFFSHSIFKIPSSKQGEMLPNFSKNIIVCQLSIWRHQARGKCCPTFPRMFFSALRCSKSWSLKQGEMLPNFFPKRFSLRDKLLRGQARNFCFSWFWFALY